MSATRTGKRITRRNLAGLSAWLCGLLLGGTGAQASPNLVANGELEQQRARAEGRVSFTGDEAIFEFPGERSFGRVSVRGRNAGRQLAEQFAVGYVALGGTRGLYLSGKDVKFNGEFEVAIWFDLHGQIRPNREYAYSLKCVPIGTNKGRQQIEMVAPAIWADGQLTGAIVRLEWAEDDDPADLGYKRGVVRTPEFQTQTGGQWLILRLPKSFKDDLLIEHVGLREMDEALLRGEKSRVPTPIRYVSIRDPLEDRIQEALTGATESLKRLQNPEGFWPAGNAEESVAVTATTLAALAAQGEDMTARPMVAGLRWLAEQQIQSIGAIAMRMYCLCRLAPTEHKRTIAADLLRLADAQLEDGGWPATIPVAEARETRSGGEERRGGPGPGRPPGGPGGRGSGGSGSSSGGMSSAEGSRERPTNLDTLTAVLALREAHYAGFDCDVKVWYKAAGYWREAQARDGGFRARMDKYGGLSEATTTHMTAIGLSGLLATLDMAYTVNARTCTQYLASSEHIAAIARAMDWLDRFYGEYFKKVRKLGEDPDVMLSFQHAAAMQTVLELSGMHRFNDRDLFRTEAGGTQGAFSSPGILDLYDPNSGLFAGNPVLTGSATSLLTDGAAPVVFQRIIVGGQPEHEFARDGDHLVRYLRTQRPEPVNWRIADMEQPIRRLVSVPILYVNVVGPMEGKPEHWQKVRDYCFSGGVVFINVAEDNRAERAKVEEGLKLAFPEYDPADLPASDPVLSVKHKLSAVKGFRVIGNGIKNFVYLPAEDWSCRLHTYQLKDFPETFQFFDNLLTYTLDGPSEKPDKLRIPEDPPYSSFAVSPWDPGGATTLEVSVARMEVGTSKPVYPDLLKTLDRIMQSGYRLKVNEVPAESSAGQARLLWVSCAGDRPLTEQERQTINAHIRAGAFVFAEVVSGKPAWVESFRADLQKLDADIRVPKLLANHPVLSGQIAETQGFDVRLVGVRRALRKDLEKLPRIDMYALEKGGAQVGVFSAHDLGSGLGYVFYPGCRGVMPEHSREAITNVILYAMQRTSK